MSLNCLRKLSTAFFLVAISLNGYGQVWKPVGNGLPQFVNSFYNYESVVNGNELVVAFCANYPFIDQFYIGISTWNGITWNNFPMLMDSSGVYPYSDVELAVFQGDYYLNAMSGLVTASALFRFD